MSHYKEIMLDVAVVTYYPIVLGTPWLKTYDPIIKWSSYHVYFSSQ